MKKEIKKLIRDIINEYSKINHFKVKEIDNSNEIFNEMYNDLKINKFKELTLKNYSLFFIFEFLNNQIDILIGDKTLKRVIVHIRNTIINPIIEDLIINNQINNETKNNNSYVKIDKKLEEILKLLKEK